MFGDIKAFGIGNLQGSYRTQRPPGDNRDIIEHSRVCGAARSDRLHRGAKSQKKRPANRAAYVLQ
ncbi:hypothetical protein GQ56_0134945 [Burkholderia paludis]|nr:hypothetical protein GQ56_0134945 [Burkholderia paludis]